MKAHPGIFLYHDHAEGCMQAMHKESTKRGLPCTCAKGCAACCYEPVYVERREVEHALSRLTPQARKEVKQRTVEWLAKIEPSGILKEAMPNVFKWRECKAACPLLKVSSETTNGYQRGQCMIYNDRPIGCRLHNACGPAADCYDDKAREHQKFIFSERVIEFLGQLAPQIFRNHTHDNLGVFLAEILLGRKVESGSYRSVAFRADKDGNITSATMITPDPATAL